MPSFDQNKPATTDNYTTGFVPSIQANFLALAMWLDSSLAGITGTIPTGAKRYNRTSGRIEEYSGSAWGNLTFNVTTADSAATATSGYFMAAAATPKMELHKPGVLAGMFYINGANKYAFVQSNGAGAASGGDLFSWDSGGNLLVLGTVRGTNIDAAGNTSGNSVTATNLSTTRSNWQTNGVLSATVGQLAWKNYGNNHTIFDASNGTNPNGGAISNVNSLNAWGPTYPTLMGFNGTDTYGVRVDTSRVSESCSGDAARSRGLTRSDSAVDGYNVQSHWDGTYWQLKGYSNTTYHAGVRVAFADTASGAATRSAGDNTTYIATTAFVQTAVASAPGLGVGQTYQDMTGVGGRASGASITNSTGRPIQVQFNRTAASNLTIVVVVGGVTIISTPSTGANEGFGVTFIVPDGVSYSITYASTFKWVELR